MRQGIVRFVGIAEKRIREDVLRILRYYRFLAHFGRGVPDAGALYSCKAAAPSLRKLSGERVRQELLKLLEAPRAAEVWRFMLQGGVMTHVLPEATDWARLQRLMDLEARFEVQPYALRRLAAALVITPEGLKPAVQGLRLSSQQATQLFSMVKYERGLSPATTVADMRRLVYYHGNDMTLSLFLLAAARAADSGAPPPTAQQDYHDIAIGFRAPEFPLRGADVMAMGVDAGATVGRALAQVESWWLSQDMRPGRDECLDYLRQRIAVLKDW